MPVVGNIELSDLSAEINTVPLNEIKGMISMLAVDEDLQLQLRNGSFRYNADADPIRVSGRYTPRTKMAAG